MFKENNSNKNYIETLLGFEQPVLWKAWGKNLEIQPKFYISRLIIWPKDTIKISPNDIINM